MIEKLPEMTDLGKISITIDNTLQKSLTKFLNLNLDRRVDRPSLQTTIQVICKFVAKGTGELLSSEQTAHAREVCGSFRHGTRSRTWEIVKIRIAKLRSFFMKHLNDTLNPVLFYRI